MMSEIFKFYMENFVSIYYVITVMGEKEEYISNFYISLCKVDIVTCF